MLIRRRIVLCLSLIVGVGALWILLIRNCPDGGLALTSRARQLHRLKNRTQVPSADQFDSQVTLDEILKPGDDSNRWSTAHAARLEGEVNDVAYARPEATNCFSPCRRDIHITVATHKAAAKTEQVIVEVTPNMREWAQTHGIDWSEETLQKNLVGHWCEFEGWMYFDVGHAEESENTSPRRQGNWRATAWEIHPLTGIRVIR